MQSELHIERLRRAYESLEGLSCGDAFGERFFVPDELAPSLIAQRALPAPPWFFTDDTIMAFSIVSVLREHGEIKQEHLVERFAASYDPSRGYGPAMHTLLTRVRNRIPSWHEESRGLFRGEGSFGNGSAMRVAPLGAYFADDLDAISYQAELSSATTHCHPEAIAGAIAVALAAGLSWHYKNVGVSPSVGEFLDEVWQRIPEGYVRGGIARARDLEPDCSLEAAVASLGNGSAVTAPDTVPFALWAAARHLKSYEEAIWTTVSALGDRDTTCAIVGGIVVLHTGLQGIPGDWLESREPLPFHLFRDTGA